MKKKWLIPTIALVWMILLSCGFPTAGIQATLSPTFVIPISGPTNSPPATLPPTTKIEQATATALPTETIAVSPSPTPCTPNVTANVDTNIRSGPGLEYEIDGALLKGKSAVVDGKSEGGYWWYIEFPAGSTSHAWLGASAVTAACIPTDLKIVHAPPTPQPPKKKKNN
jgi:uncharacterized protein YgiM (DUF1202 family)